MTKNVGPISSRQDWRRANVESVVSVCLIRCSHTGSKSKKIKRGFLWLSWIMQFVFITLLWGFNGHHEQWWKLLPILHSFHCPKTRNASFFGGGILEWGIFISSMLKSIGNSHDIFKKFLIGALFRILEISKGILSTPRICPEILVQQIIWSVLDFCIVVSDSRTSKTLCFTGSAASCSQFY